MLEEPFDPEHQPLFRTTTSSRDFADHKNDSSMKKVTLAECVWILLINGIPTIMSYIGSYLMFTMNIHFLSDSGQLAWFGGAGLGQTWINTTFIYVIACLNIGTVIISSPAFGAKNNYLVGINYHRGAILNLIITIPCYILVIFSYQIFMTIGIEQQIAYEAYIYGLYSLPTIISMCILNTTNMFVLTHKIYAPFLINQILVVIFHWGSCEFYIVYLQLGVKGAALAYATSIFFGTILIFLYILWSDEFKETFFWFKKESFQGLFTQLKNEFFIGAPYYLEWLSFELFTLLSMTFGTIQLDAWVVLYHMISIIYMVPLGFGLVISQQIASSIGERDLDKTKTLLKVSIYFSIIVGVMDVGIVYLCRKPFIGIYDGGNQEIYEATISLVMLYLIMMPADFLQFSVMSILKAVGKEKIATFIFFVGYYAVGMPLAWFFGIYQGLESRGVLIGVTTGCYFLLALSSIILYFTDIKAQSDEIYQSRTR